ncbi:MAG: bifunctional phosphopantothenoylcysteine decarboxylase/phosphopantothenate--cysteine ligase CoaBC [Deltaproteobacteria bacterium]|nr:bifunctional phosphopantothenoylcysteine decarboxylase/phosphopantothenate--cysteine ligase CoaBC [Deltaproteobacteria bacterium]
MNSPPKKNTLLLLGISGGIAAYKTPDLVRRLRDEGFDVHVVLTPTASQFVTPLSLQAVSQNPVHSELFDLQQESQISHIKLADLPELIVVAPATADLIAKYAHGLCNDLLSTLLVASTRPVLLCPSMNSNMWNHPATQANLKILQDRGVHILEPDSGSLACGHKGAGRLPELPEIVTAIKSCLAPKTLKGKKILITAGPTREHLDPVRYLSSPSSGKTGYFLAEEAKLRGAEVYLVSGPSCLKAAKDIHLISIATAQEMFDAVKKISTQMDIVICSAAVSDFKPEQISEEKVKKNKAELEIKLIQNPDILAYLGEYKSKKQILVGFAAETFEVESHAQEKLNKKNLDFICANDVSKPDLGFASDENIMTLIFPGRTKPLPLLSKKKIAEEILDEVESLLA